MTATRVVVVSDVERLMEIGDKVEKESQRLGTIEAVRARIRKDTLEAITGSRDAAARRAIPSRIIAGCEERDVDEMQCGGVATMAANLICPHRCVCHALPGQEVTDSRGCMAVQTILGYVRHESVPQLEPS